MSWHEESQEGEGQGQSTAEVVGAEPESSDALYKGDRGELRLETRRALVRLLSGPSLEGRHHGKLWTALLRDEAILRSRLSDLFLELVLDREAQVAFTQQAETPGLEVPVLLRRSPLTFMDAILLLALRQRLAQASVHGDRAVVSGEEMMSDLAVYERVGNTDRAGFSKRVRASIEKFKKRSILQKIRSSDDRFEISPTLKLLFSAEEVQAMTLQYERMAREEMSPAIDAESDEELEG